MDGTSIERLAELLSERAWLGRLARGLTNDAGAAEDLAQETWLAAWQDGPADARSWRAWLARTARNLAAGVRRGDGRRAQRERAAAQGEALPASDELVAKSELLELVARETLALDEPFRRTLLLRFQEGLEPVEIAVREGVPADTVRFRLRRGLLLLRTRLERRLGPEWTAHVLLLVPSSRVPLPPAAGPVATVVTAAGGLVVLKGIAAVAGAVVLVVAYSAWRAGDAPEGVSRGELSAREVADVSLRSDVPRASARQPTEAALTTRSRKAHAAEARAPETFATACQLIGRVVGELDEPLAGVEIRGYRGRERESLARTAADGTFRGALERPHEVQALQIVADPHHELRLLRFGGDDPSAAWLAPGQRDLGTLVLGAAGALAGTVVDAEGAPLAGAFLVIGQGGGVSYPGDGGWTFSEAGGAFVLGHVRAGAWELAVHCLGFRILRRPVEVVAGATAHVDLALEPGPLVTGRVCDEDGAPVGGVEIQPCGYWYAWGVVTDADGRFELALASDEPCTLEVEAEGWDVVSGLGRACSPGTRDVEIVLRRAEGVRFRVVDEVTREPVEHYGLAVEQEGESFTGPPSPVTHASGECLADARPGERVHVRAPGYLDEEQIVEPEAWGGVTISLQRGATLAGRVTRDGRALAGASVRLARRFGTLRTAGNVPARLLVERDTTEAVAGALDAAPPAYPGRAWSALEMRSDVDGAFAFTGLDERDWSLEVCADDGAGLLREGLQAPAELGTLEVAPPVRVAGRVEFALPGALGGHTVLLEGLPERSATTDASGAFAFEGVSAGEHWLRVVPAEERIAPPTVFFLRLAPEEPRDVVLRVEDWPATRLGLTLLDNGRPRAEAVRMRFMTSDRDGLGPLELVPDAHGRVELVLPALGIAWIELVGEERIVRHPEPLALFPGVLEWTADFTSGALELSFPAGLALHEGARLELHVVAEDVRSAPLLLSLEVRDGHVVDAHRRALGPLEGPLRIEALPAGGATLDLLIDGKRVGGASGSVPVAGTWSAALR